MPIIPVNCSSPFLMHCTVVITQTHLLSLCGQGMLYTEIKYTTQCSTTLDCTSPSSTDLYFTALPCPYSPWLSSSNLMMSISAHLCQDMRLGHAHEIILISTARITECKLPIHFYIHFRPLHCGINIPISLINRLGEAGAVL